MLNASTSPRPDDDAGVEAFAAWWVKEKPFAPPADAMRHMKGIDGITLYRDGPFQVQMFLGRAGASAPRHRHPNIDVIDIVLCGSAVFFSERSDYNDTKTEIRVRPNEAHITRSSEGGAFVSFQKWLNGVAPSSVELDWVGEPIDPNHAAAIAAAN